LIKFIKNRKIGIIFTVNKLTVDWIGKTCGQNIYGS